MRLEACKVHRKKILMRLGLRTLLEGGLAENADAADQRAGVLVKPPPAMSALICFDTQTRPVWDCHIYAAPLTLKITPTDRHIWQSYGVFGICWVTMLLHVLQYVLPNSTQRASP